MPESIRIRYVWGCVTISMLFILAIWIFSMGSLFQNGNIDEENESVANITEQLKDLKKDAPSLKDLSNEKITTNQEGIAKNTDNPQLQNLINENYTEAPQADAYSNLPLTEAAQ